uniref:MD-2-related lipid-recognition domain-containing protein n=1 Tax=Glossina palpalis gambiensis TaxID=67801 RepID=A0A1B0BF04_9MUSC
MFAVKSIILMALIAVALGEVIDFKTCDTNDCDIHEVRVEPCPQAESHAACNIRRRKPANMSFDFTPHFDADTLEASLNWVKSNDQELPLISMEKDACKYTKCPVKNGEKQTYQVDIPIESKFPLNYYTIKWNFQTPNGKQCCFTHDIKLVR